MAEWIKSTLLLLATCVLGFGVLEAATRIIVGAPWPEQLPVVRVRADQDVGWVMLPNDVHYTYDVKVELNSLGFRGPEVGMKSLDEYRILAIGDSHIYGQGLPNAEILTNLLAKSLNSEGGQCRFNVVNMAARAYSTNQQIALYEKLGQKLDADHIVLFFYINDFVDVNIDKRYERYKHIDWYMFDLDAKPNAEIQAKWQRRQLLRKSAFVMWVYDHIKELRVRGNFFQQLLEGMKTDEVVQKLGRMRNHLDRFSALANEKGVKFTLAIIPAPVQVSHEFKNELYQSQLIAYAEENNIPSIDLRMGLQSYYRTQGRIPVIPFDGHFDSAGNEVMAEQVHSQLLAEGLHCGKGL